MEGEGKGGSEGKARAAARSREVRAALCECGCEFCTARARELLPCLCFTLMLVTPLFCSLRLRSRGDVLELFLGVAEACEDRFCDFLESLFPFFECERPGWVFFRLRE